MMRQIKCESCGAPLDISSIMSGMIKCRYCGLTQQVDLTFSDDVDEVKYKEALQKLSSAKTEDEFKKTAELFKEILDYKDSRSHRDDCVLRAESMRNDRIYREAVELAEEDYYYSTKQAINLFSSIPEWKDSSEWLKRCRQKLLDEERIHQSYERAVNTNERKAKAGVWLYVIGFAVLPFVIAALIGAWFKFCAGN